MIFENFYKAFIAVKDEIKIEAKKSDTLVYINGGCDYLMRIDNFYDLFCFDSEDDENDFYIGEPNKRLILRAECIDNTNYKDNNMNLNDFLNLLEYIMECLSLSNRECEELKVCTYHRKTGKFSLKEIKDIKLQVKKNNEGELVNYIEINLQQKNAEKYIDEKYYIYQKIFSEKVDKKMIKTLEMTTQHFGNYFEIIIETNSYDIDCGKEPYELLTYLDEEGFIKRSYCDNIYEVFLLLLCLEKIGCKFDENRYAMINCCDISTLSWLDNDALNDEDLAELVDIEEYFSKMEELFLYNVELPYVDEYCHIDESLTTQERLLIFLNQFAYIYMISNGFLVSLDTITRVQIKHISKGNNMKEEILDLKKTLDNIHKRFKI